jgi:hypothetical protein
VLGWSCTESSARGALRASTRAPTEAHAFPARRGRRSRVQGVADAFFAQSVSTSPSVGPSIARPATLAKTRCRVRLSAHIARTTTIDLTPTRPRPNVLRVMVLTVSHVAQTPRWRRWIWFKVIGVTRRRRSQRCAAQGAGAGPLAAVALMRVTTEMDVRPNATRTSAFAAPLSLFQSGIDACSPPTDCKPGFYGPRCELCDGLAYSMYFDTTDARCHDCNDRLSIGAAVLGPLVLLLLASLGGAAFIVRIGRCPKAAQALSRRARYFVNLWRRAGMRYKVGCGKLELRTT